MRLSTLALCAGLLGGCATAQLSSGAGQLRAYFEEKNVRDCAYLGEVVGSEGHWYNAWFIANDVLMTGALNDLRNRALAKGADTLFVTETGLSFKTSVTVLGQAFRCKK